MLGAIYIGLSGMNAYSRGLQTISNNVANMNSPGFKAASVNFTDVFNVGGLGSSYTGSQNRSSGAGVRFGTPGVDFTQGDMRQTGGDLDLAVQGGGFLTLSDGDRRYFARTGQFAVDTDGYVSLIGTSYRLNVLDDARRLSELNIGDRRTSPPVATTTVRFSDNLSSTATTAVVSDIAVYDSRGGRQVWTVTLAKADPTTPGTGSGTEWTVTVKDQAGATVGTSALRFIGSIVDPSTARLTVTDTPEGADPLSVVLDFSSGVTSFSSGTSSTLRAASVDGRAVGALTTVGINDKGRVELKYSNGRTEVLGSVALADVRDPQSLERVGNGLFRNAGGADVRYLESEVEGIGRLVSKQLEASNVDLAQQFGDLILIQRGFQASSQVVSVSNDMIQQLFGIRGQG